ncbi:MAG: molybdopterin-dependent oxidoreductase [Bacteroidota bacterium]
MSAPFPPGQVETGRLRRFGIPVFADRFPRVLDRIEVRIEGDVATPLTLGSEWDDLPRVEQVSDLHCVTSWTVRDLRWGGVRFRDVFERVLVSRAGASPEAEIVVFRGQDGYRAALPLPDLLAPDVLLADRLGGEPLSVAHGAPLRLVAPAHYGYKSVKHVSRITVWQCAEGYREPGPAFLTHPRGRVALEERSAVLPGRLLRYAYRPFIRPVAARFARELRAWEAARESSDSA